MPWLIVSDGGTRIGTHHIAVKFRHRLPVLQQHRPEGPALPGTILLDGINVKRISRVGSHGAVVVHDQHIGKYLFTVQFAVANDDSVVACAVIIAVYAQYPVVFCQRIRNGSRAAAIFASSKGRFQIFDIADINIRQIVNSIATLSLCDGDI